MPGLDRFDERRRSMPASRGARLDEARATLAALREEQARCERLGLELPLARCHERIRYWQFVNGLLAITPLVTPGGAACDGASR